MLEALFDTIKAFGWLSGLKVNWDKSSLSGVNIDSQKDALTAKKFNCKPESLPILYLGLPLGEPEICRFLESYYGKNYVEARKVEEMPTFKRW